MVRYRNVFVALALAGGVAPTLIAQDRLGRPDDVTIECASRDGRRTSCPADLQGYTFRGMRKQGNAPCEAGRNWGYTERGIWVDAGCHAEFEFEHLRVALSGRSDEYRSRDRPSSDERVVECVSDDNRREECSADLRGMRFVDVRQQSRTTCEIGRNFGYNDRGVWVDEGCRGEFLFRSDRVADAGVGVSDARGNLVTCESVDDDYQHCDAPGIVSARVASQASRSDCVQGSTWGVDERGIWVDRGCRAEFEIFTRLSDSPTGPSRW